MSGVDDFPPALAARFGEMGGEIGGELGGEPGGEPGGAVDADDSGVATLLPAETAGAAPALRWLTLHGGVREGLRVLEVNNGRLRYWLLPQRGMGIWKAWLDGYEIGWQSPLRGPVHPQFVPLAEAGGLGWLDGFDELLCRCGLESNGAPEFDQQGRLRYALHGRIANLPAHSLSSGVDAGSGEIRVAAVVDESRFHFQKLRLQTTVATLPGSRTIAVRDRVSNRAGRPGSFQLLYHINFGAPLLDAGSRLLAPVRTLVPRTAHAAAGIAHWDRIGAPQADFAEEVYFLDLLADEAGQTEVMLRNAAADRGVSLHFNRAQLPCFTLWKNTAALADGYVVGLEPGLNFPNPRSYEADQGRVAALAPGEARELEVAIEIHHGAAEVALAAARVARLQAAAAPVIHPAPLAGWCVEAR